MSLAQVVVTASLSRDPRYPLQAPWR